MTIKLEIKETDVEPLKQFYQNRLNQISGQIDMLKADLEGITRVLAKLNSEPLNGEERIESIQRKNGYPAKGTWVDRIEFILNNANKPISTSQIVKEIITRYQPELERGKVVASVSATLTAKAHENRYLKTKNEKNENTFQLNQKPLI